MTEKSSIFYEGKEAAIQGEHHFSNPHKECTENYREWREGWFAGAKEHFDNFPWKEKAEHWERMWRQSELEKHIIIRALDPFIYMADEYMYGQPIMSENPKDVFDRVLYKSEDGKKTIKISDCIRVEHIVLSNQCADIEEIEEYDRRECERKHPELANIFSKKRKKESNDS